MGLTGRCWSSGAHRGAGDETAPEETRQERAGEPEKPSGLDPRDPRLRRAPRDGRKFPAKRRRRAGENGRPETRARWGLPAENRGGFRRNGVEGAERTGPRRPADLRLRGRPAGDRGGFRGSSV